MAMAGGTGADLCPPLDPTQAASFPWAWGFGEDQGRYLVAVGDGASLIARSSGRPGSQLGQLGRSGGATLTLFGSDLISVAELNTAFEAWLPDYMAV